MLEKMVGECQCVSGKYLSCFKKREQNRKKIKIPQIIANHYDVLTLQNFVVEQVGYNITCTTKNELSKLHMKKSKEHLERGA